MEKIFNSRDYLKIQILLSFLEKLGALASLSLLSIRGSI